MWQQDPAYPYSNLMQRLVVVRLPSHLKVPIFQQHLTVYHPCRLILSLKDSGIYKGLMRHFHRGCRINPYFEANDECPKLWICERVHLHLNSRLMGDRFSDQKRGILIQVLWQPFYFVQYQVCQIQDHKYHY